MGRAPLCETAPAPAAPAAPSTYANRRARSRESPATSSSRRCEHKAKERIHKQMVTSAATGNGVHRARAPPKPPRARAHRELLRQCVAADSAPRGLFTRRGRLACPHGRCRRACLGRGHVCSAGREAFTQGLQRTCVGAEARSATCKLTLQPAAPQHANKQIQIQIQNILVTQVKHRDRMRRGQAITHRVAPRPQRGEPLRPLLPLSRVSTDVHRADSHTPRLRQRQDQRSGEQEGHPRQPTAESSRAT